MSGTTVVVTGSTRGIGRGLAEQLLARGANVVVTGRSAAAVDRAVAEMSGSRGDRILGQPCDVRNAKDLQDLWDAATARFGSVDIWINNAGISTPRYPIWDLPTDTVDAVIDTNLRGSIHGTRIAVAGMLRQGRGTVYNMEGFGSGNQQADGMTTYGTTKRAVRYLSEAANKDLTDSPVRVGTISPGIVVTDLLVADYEDQPERLEKAKKIFNILGDHVEPVTSYLAEQLLSADPPPQKIKWLTKPKVFARFATAAFRKRDLFAD